MQPGSDQFVSVSPDGSHLTLGLKPFYFAGANCYYLLTRAADPALRHQVTEVLDAARKAGLTVIRTWAFCDGQEWNALQPKPGEFDERVFQGLDFVVHEAGKRGLKLMLVLTSFWKAYGGMPQYVRWSCERRGLPVTDRAELFYADPRCQDVFQNFLVTITSRTNTLTKQAYRDDPSIMSWALANEPRCPGDYAASTLEAWIAPTAEFLKSIDPNHLITLGSEGFLGSSSPDLIIDNPYDTLAYGCDFLRHHMCEHIDFATIHLWPDNWLPNADEDQKLRFARRWINSHVDACATLGKPLVIAEFGKKNDDGLRAAFYEKVYGVVLQHAKSGRYVVGSCCWMIAAASYPDYDGFTVYLTPPSAADAAAKLEAEMCAAQIADRMQAGETSPRTPAIADRGRRADDQEEASSEGAELDSDWVTPSRMARVASSSAADQVPKSDVKTVELIVHHAAAMRQLNGGDAASRDCVVM
ncbi:hypothetical protein WJX72_006760 [[Myrmecia] bisecta]|uniref:mannan endo-1,4-beta-mannosidase n=1 Tax=[Myrmecia] bisecta TaxID=41462 RepID=A0AAW1QFD6_9CHLO